MKYDFTTLPDRHGRDSIAVDGLGKGFAPDAPQPGFDAIPMWVADMDFACAPCIVEAVQKRAAHPVYGYGVRQQPYYDAVMGWLKKRHGFEVNYEHLAFAPPGVIYAMNVMLRILTKPGDRVMVPMPNYDPLFDMVTRGGRELVETPLVWKDGRYTFDFADMEAKAASGVKVLVLSSPHNPTGRVWTRQELEGVAEICLRHNIFMLVDEIHCDLIRTGIKHIPLGKIMPDYNKLITTMSASKTFNLAGMLFSNIIIRSEEERARFNQRDKNIGAANPLSIAAHKAAYEQGDQWLTELKLYIDDNMKAVKEFLTQHLPDAEFEIPDATYFAWVDLQKVLPDVEDLPMFFANNAGVLLEGGDQLFVGNAKGYVRLNLAMPRAMLMTGLERIADAVKKHRA